VSHLLPQEFVLSDEWATKHVTIEDALSHRTGYPRHDLAVATSPRDLVFKFRHLPMSAEPRVKFQYNNMMFEMAGYLVTKLTGSPLGTFFRSRLWEPMGMNETFLGLDDPALHGSGLRVADEYYYKNSTGEYVRLKHAELNIIAGAGAVVSNVLDYAKYLRIMMNEEGPISKAGHRELKTSRSFYGNAPQFVGPITYTLGWMSGVVHGEQIWLHSGQVNEFTTWMLMIPSKKIGITVMTNSASDSLTIVLYRILYDVLGVKEQDRFDFAAKYGTSSHPTTYSLLTCNSGTRTMSKNKNNTLPRALNAYTQVSPRLHSRTRFHSQIIRARFTIQATASRM
jgi:CubicO group peptidase (beta-lactamase class C family)